MKDEVLVKIKKILKVLIKSPIILVPFIIINSILTNLIKIYLIISSQYLTIIQKQELFHLNGDFLSFTIRPNTLYKSQKFIDKTRNYSNVGVIIEGPYFSVNNFTLFTIKWLLINYQQIRIIYICSSKLKKRDQKKLTVLGNQYSNFELITKTQTLYDEKWRFLPNQIESVNLGLSLLNSDSRIEYIMKLRSDARFYEINTIDYLKYLVNIDYNKIVALKMNTFYDRLFSINDMFHFASIKAFNTFWNYNYFDMKLINDFNKEYDAFIKLNLGNYGYYEELFLNSQYMLRLNMSYNLSMLGDLVKYRSFVRSHFTLINKANIDYFWLKNRGLEYLLENDYEEDPMFHLAKNEFHFIENANDSNIS